MLQQLLNDEITSTDARLLKCDSTEYVILVLKSFCPCCFMDRLYCFVLNFNKHN
jgi:hypothetical protein